jgi:hypothetical protein
MTFVPKFDHKQASITLYSVIALNTKRKSKNTINRKDAAQVLAKLIQINSRAPKSWLRGNFKTHPISHENFLKFVRIYRTKRGLENVKAITALAIDLYGRDYKRAIELLDPADRESDLVQDVLVTLSGKVNLATAICNLIETSSPEELKNMLITMISSISGLPVIPVVEII